MSADTYITPPSSWPREATPTDLVPAWAGEFKDINDWIAFASKRLTGVYHPVTDAQIPAICVDALGRRCHCGADFQRADREAAFPVRYFWDMRPAAPSEGEGH